MVLTWLTAHKPLADLPLDVEPNGSSSGGAFQQAVDMLSGLWGALTAWGQNTQLAQLAQLIIVGAVAVGAWMLIRDRWLIHAHQNATHWRIIAGTDTPETMEEAARRMSAAAGGFERRRGWRRRGMVIWRWVDHGAVSVGVTLWGVDDPDKTAAMLAWAAGGEPQPMDGPPPVNSRLPIWGRSYRGDWRPGDPRAGDFDAVTEWATEVFSHSTDDSAAVGVLLEPMRTWEVKRLRRWMDARSTWRRSMGAGSAEGVGGVLRQYGSSILFRCHVIAGAERTGTARSLATGLPRQLPGFDFAVHPRIVSSRPWWALTATLMSLGALGFWGAGRWPVAALSTLVALTGWLMAGTDSISPSRTRYRRWATRGLIPAGKPRIISIRRGFIWLGLLGQLKTRINKEVDDPETNRPAPHPHRRWTYTLSPMQAATLAAPPSRLSTSSATSEATTRRNAPPIVRSLPQGTLIGYDPEGWAVRIPDSDRARGLFIVGDPGRGKSTCALTVWWSDLIARRWGTAPGTGPQRNGNMTLLWFETKGEGAQRAARTAQRAGYRPEDIIVVDVAGTQGPRLELVDRYNPGRGALALVGAMKYAFEAGSIAAASEEALRSAFRLALSVDHGLAQQMGIGPEPNVMRLALILLGADEGARDYLLARLRETLETGDDHPALPVGVTPDDFEAAFDATADANLVARLGGTTVPLRSAIESLERYVGLPRNQREAVLEPPRNKVAALLAAEGLWEPDPTRPTVTLDQILTYHQVVVLNFGGAAGGTEMLAARLASMTLHLLWEQIKVLCDNWQAQGRSVGIFADELADIAGHGAGDDIIRLLIDQGRSRGVQTVFATQRPTQLPDRTSEAALSSGSKVYLGLENINLAEAAWRDLTGGDEGSYTPRDIRQLPAYEGIARLRVGGEPQPPFHIHVVNDTDLDIDQYPNARRELTP